MFGVLAICYWVTSWKTICYWITTLEEAVCSSWGKTISTASIPWLTIVSFYRVES